MTIRAATLALVLALLAATCNAQINYATDSYCFGSPPLSQVAQFGPIQYPSNPVCGGDNVVMMNRIISVILNPNGFDGVQSLNAIVGLQAVCGSATGPQWLDNIVDYCTMANQANCKLGDWTTSVTTSQSNPAQIPCPAIGSNSMSSLTCSKFVTPSCNMNCVGVFSQLSAGYLSPAVQNSNGWYYNSFVAPILDNNGNRIINQNLVDASSFQISNGCMYFTNVFNSNIPA